MILILLTKVGLFDDETSGNEGNRNEEFAGKNDYHTGKFDYGLMVQKISRIF